MKSSRSIAAFLLSALALVAGVSPLAADPTRGHNLRNAAHTHVVKVDSGGYQGDYKDLSEAAAWVAGKAPVCTAPWTILLYAGVGYSETNVTIPPCTTIQGVPDLRPTIGLTNLPVLTLTGTTGALITPSSNSALANLEIVYTATPTGATQLFNAASVSAKLSNVLFTVTPGSDAQNLDVIATSGTGSLTLYGVSVSRGAGTATKTRDLVSGGSGVTNVYGGVFTTAGTSQAKLIEVTAGTLNLFAPQLGTTATTQLTQTGGALNQVGTNYSTSSGTVGNDTIHAAALYLDLTTPASAAATCKAGQITADAGFLYFCTAANTWKRVAIATW